VYVEKHAQDVPKFHFCAVGVWDEDAMMKFYVPANPAHVSHSVLNLQKTELTLKPSASVCCSALWAVHTIF
jgi:hypothetical protein